MEKDDSKSNTGCLKAIVILTALFLIASITLKLSCNRIKNSLPSFGLADHPAESIEAFLNECDYSGSEKQELKNYLVQRFEKFGKENGLLTASINASLIPQTKASCLLWLNKFSNTHLDKAKLTETQRITSKDTVARFATFASTESSDEISEVLNLLGTKVDTPQFKGSKFHNDEIKHILMRMESLLTESETKASKPYISLLADFHSSISEESSSKTN